MSTARDIAFGDIKVGDAHSATFTITPAMVATFSELTGDYNPLHMDEAYAQTTVHGRRVVHGMLVASFFSEFVGMHLPGKRSLILSESAQFCAPTYIGDTITVSGTVSHVSAATQTVTLDMQIMRDDTLLVRGEITVLVT